MNKEKLERSFMLHNTADKLGYDDTTRRAMGHFESIDKVLTKKGLTWDDVPEECSFEELFSGFSGRIALKFARRSDGFRAVEEAYNDPAKRPPLFNAYNNCIKVAGYTGTASYADVLEHYRQEGRF
jgi:hypothetical protein